LPSTSASARHLVTGVAGFIGSHLAERLVADGHQVIGVDSFTDYYDRRLKEANLAGLGREPRFILVEQDLLAANLPRLLDGVVAVYHQAGQPGVRASWGTSFEPYVRCNILATQALLEAARSAGRLERLVYASSSSIYGNADDLPTRETALPRPVSPYGVTKLAAEHLCVLYAALGVPTVSLRYFTVYGPRQRPDMAFNRFIHALLEGGEIAINGDGEQTRDFTYVDDIVDANLAAAAAPVDRVAGKVYNLGGGSQITVNQVLAMLEALTERRVTVRHQPEPPGEARHTRAGCGAAQADLGWRPRHTLESGLRAEVDWIARQVAA
jgi:UDP-glucuronate 4-epimerase